MASSAVEVVRATFAAFVAGDLEALRSYVDPDLEWTFLDPTEEDPVPRSCTGRAELEAAAGRWARSGLGGALEEVQASGNLVRVVMHVPGLDASRARSTGDRNFHVATVRDGVIVTLVACRDHDEQLLVFRNG